MRIVFPLLSIRHHGGVRVIIHIANYLASRGHTVTLITPADRFAPLYEIDRRVGVYLTRPVGNLSYVSHLLNISRLYFSMDHSDFIVPNFFPTFYPAFLASRRGKGHLVYLVQDYEPFFYGGLTRIVSELTYKFRADVVAVSHWLARRIGKHARRVKVIPPGPQDGVFYPDEVPELIKDAEYPVILYMWRYEKRKGSAVFAEAVRLLSRKGRHFELWLILSGKKPIRIDIDRPVKLFGPVKDNMLRQLYSCADIFVNASYYEGFGLPPLEAMACGTPTVLTRSGGVEEYAVDGLNSLLVPPGDPHKLADAIEKLIFNERLRRKLAANALETAEKFSLNKMAREVEEFLIELAG